MRKQSIHVFPVLVLTVLIALPAHGVTIEASLDGFRNSNFGSILNLPALLPGGFPAGFFGTKNGTPSDALTTGFFGANQFVPARTWYPCPRSPISESLRNAIRASSSRFASCRR